MSVQETSKNRTMADIVGKISFFYFLLFIFMGSGIVFSQENIGGTPLSFSMENLRRTNIPVYYIVPPTSNEVDELHCKNKTLKESMYFAVNRECNIDVRNFSSKDSVDCGIIYRMSVVSKGATSIGLFFSSFHLPLGATLYVYNQFGAKGAFSSYNNSSTNTLPIAHLKGDSIVIEYFEPYFLSLQETDLVIGRISHGVLSDSLRYNDCEMDINCPEGSDWQSEKRSVCKIEINNNIRCTGTLINNTSNDGKPYILTANHCVNNQNAADGCVFIFNYENSACYFMDATENCSMAGGDLRATSNTTDFTLIELKRRIPSNYHPYFAGWSRKTPTEEGCACIHHPNGDAKKISISKTIPETSNCIDNVYDPSKFWIIKNWYKGITEPGSSGAALFNVDHKVIGQLFGACVYHNGGCENPENAFSNYGKLGESWDNGGNPSNRLKEWLDSDDYGILELSGLESCDSMVMTNVILSEGLSNMNTYISRDLIITTQTIHYGECVNYQAGEEIIFNDGFEAENGSEMEALISSFDCVVSCPRINVEQWVDTASYGGRIRYHVLNADTYRFVVYNEMGQLIYSSSGNVTGDFAEVWTNIDVEGIFYVTIGFKSTCGDEVSHTYILNIGNRTTRTHSDRKILYEKEKNNEMVDAIDRIVTISPNPAKEYIKVEVKINTPYKLQITNMLGESVIQWDYINANRIIIDTSKMNKGIYLMNIRYAGKLIIKKIIIQ